MDSRRNSLGQNRNWGSWADIGLRVPFTHGHVAASWNVPVIGRSYPDIPPDQFQEREPLLGNRLTVEFAWHLDFDRDHRRGEAGIPLNPPLEKGDL